MQIAQDLPEGEDGSNLTPVGVDDQMGVGRECVLVGQQEHIGAGGSNDFIDMSGSQQDGIVAEPSQTSLASNSTVKPMVDPTIESMVDPMINPTIESPMVDPIVDPTIESMVDPMIDPIVDPTTESPTVDPMVDPIVNPTTESPTVDPIVDPTIESPMVDTMVDPTIESMEDPVEQAAEPAADGVSLPPGWYTDIDLASGSAPYAWLPTSVLLHFLPTLGYCSTEQNECQGRDTITMSISTRLGITMRSRPSANNIICRRPVRVMTCLAYQLSRILKLA